MPNKDIEILKELAKVKFVKQLLKSLSIIKEQDEVYLLNIQERQAIENVLSELETYKKIAEKLAEELTKLTEENKEYYLDWARNEVNKNEKNNI